MSKKVNNRTIALTERDRKSLRKEILKIAPGKKLGRADIQNSIIEADSLKIATKLPKNCADVLFLDPPYNLAKTYNGKQFRKLSDKDYGEWVESWLVSFLPVLKPDASVYFCCDWRTSPIVFNAVSKHLYPVNRITFEREKGRGAQRNWKNNLEDIWFFAKSQNYFFNPEPIKIKRRVLAPYREKNVPKDWANEDGIPCRLTGASNLWSDITIPFWSMPENTPHPTQKPEKILARILLASSRPGDTVLDPFGGSGTTAAVAKKLGRYFILIEQEHEYCLYAAKRTSQAEFGDPIQGYTGKHFLDRGLQRKVAQLEKQNIPLKAV